MKIFEIVGKIAVDNASANQEIKETTGIAESSSQEMDRSFGKIATAVATAFSVSKIVEFGKTCVDTAADIRASTSQFNQTFTTGGEDLRGKAKDILNDIGSQSGILATRLQDSGTQIYAFAKSSGASSSEAMELMEQALMASADSAAYYDKSLEETTNTMMSFLKGNYENDAALGVSATEFTRNEKAVELFGKKFNDLSETQKQKTLLQMVLDSQELSGAMGQASREADGWDNVQGNLNESWRQFMGVLGDPVLSLVTPIVQTLSDTVSSATEYVKGLKQSFEENKSTIENVGIALGIVTGAFVAFKAGAMLDSVVKSFQDAKLASALFTGQQGASNVAQGILNGTLTLGEGIVALFTGKVTLAQLATTAWTKAQTVLHGVLNANPIGVVVAVIGTLVGAFTLAYNKCEWFRNMVDNAFSVIKNAVGTAVQFIKTNIVDKIGSAISFAVGKFEEIKNKATNVFNSVKNSIMNPIQSARDFVKNAVDAMKGFFNFKWELPKIKLPHFSVKGSANPIDWLTQGIPKISVDWYAKGGILTEPTAFGINPSNGNLRVGGEAGDEAVAPIETLLGYVRTAVNESNSGMYEALRNIILLMTEYFPQFANMQVVLNNGVLVGELIDDIDDGLGDKKRRKGR